MMRRRALLAASQTGGGGDTPEFPLYLYFDYCEDEGFIKICVREADEISNAYFSYLINMISIYGIYNGYAYVLDESSLNALGIEIYIDGDKIQEISSTLDPSYTYIEYVTSKSPYGIWGRGSITQDFE